MVKSRRRAASSTVKPGSPVTAIPRWPGPALESRRGSDTSTAPSVPSRPLTLSTGKASPTASTRPTRASASFRRGRGGGGGGRAAARPGGGGAGEAGAGGGGPPGPPPRHSSDEEIPGQDELLRVGDADGRVTDSAFVGDETPGGDMPTPDQNQVDDI